MLYLVLPCGSDYGRGIRGQYLTRELAGLTRVSLITEPYTVKDAGDELVFDFLRRISLDRAGFAASLAGQRLEAPVIQAVDNDIFLPLEPGIRGSLNLGYTFHENAVLSRDQIQNARAYFDLLVAGSTWLEGVLRDNGLAEVRTVVQGVDRSVFNPAENQKTLLRDRFVIFSGGKLELRKGHDLVIRAIAVLQERYGDVWLVNSWFNHWPSGMRGLAASPYIRFPLEPAEYVTFINRLLAANGLDVERTITLKPRPCFDMARIYKNTDLGLFPNRCEGGTNLVLMEYLACGKPALVSDSSGHRDVANDRNALMLRRLKPFQPPGVESLAAGWLDPDLDEIIDKLDWAYHHRTELEALGRAAGESMIPFTWRAAAERFRDLASP